MAGLRWWRWFWQLWLAALGLPETGWSPLSCGQSLPQRGSLWKCRAHWTVVLSFIVLTWLNNRIWLVVLIVLLWPFYPMIWFFWKLLWLSPSKNYFYDLKYYRPSAVTNACNSCSLQGGDWKDPRSRPAWVKSSWDLISINKSWAWWCAPVIPAMWGSPNRRKMV
jgi:hypothetical protein